ncbi:flagellar basal body P-ring formation chaperone FlgA [Aliiroseovarius sp.]|uniref:flagellar basal body P-ring formation chaperone FlgA n=1 Tax=Aliiroseovarius sp. TaxID=1872442 RepID=UPI0026095586|nr:flagellar basal body P-ring formation chaperone FlgA [Aliiroseovarius sp.]
MIRILALLLMSTPAFAEIIVPTRTIRSQAILGPGDVQLIQGEAPGTYVALDEVVGQEARVVLYAGRPIRIEDIGPPALIERNQIVTIYYVSGPLIIAAEARSLSRGGIGDTIRAMNLGSRNTVTGIIRADGTVTVNPPTIPSM